MSKKIYPREICKYMLYEKLVEAFLLDILTVVIKMNGKAW